MSIFFFFQFFSFFNLNFFFNLNHYCQSLLLSVQWLTIMIQIDFIVNLTNILYHSGSPFQNRLKCGCHYIWLPERRQALAQRHKLPISIFNRLGQKPIQIISSQKVGAWISIAVWLQMITDDWHTATNLAVHVRLNANSAFMHACMVLRLLFCLVSFPSMTLLIQSNIRKVQIGAICGPLCFKRD